ncbi:hypothetical protein PUMCH_002112 [Australozyma saopauloensis]|uniref:Phosphoribulokinase/uridine kinase domain-containing protein n=1 Tax=Australozyma saopauloensis TaxID=291208 RepID=A0AAX4H8A4_9ASCO|nr:hypothetical protein PUMCH_002112 [[Candida] saopauloensis]
MGLIIVGVGGPSSSGKTTICNSLRTILPQCTLIHLDDFYLPDGEIPMDADLQLENWDCPEAIDWPKFQNYIDEIRATGGDVLPVESKESESLLKLSKEEIDEAQTLIERKYPELLNSHVVLIDGFMLYHDVAISNLFDVKLYFRAPYQMLKARREARAGYATSDGFWVDPPGYFDQIVWPQYVLTHKYLFLNDDVEGELKEESKKSGLKDIFNDNTKSIKQLVLLSLDSINDALSHTI